MSVLNFDELICNIFKSSGVFREEHQSYFSNCVDSVLPTETH